MPPVDDPATASAIRRLEDRLAREPTSLAFAALADLYRKTGRLADAIATCRAGLDRYPHYTMARLVLARALVAHGALEEALAEVRTILELSPKDLQSHRLAADIHRRLGRIDDSVKHLETVVALDPGDRDSRTVLALLRADTPAPGTATGLSRVLRDETFVTGAFGTLCLEQGCPDEAALVFTRILRHDPGNLEARVGLEQALGARSRRKG
jgi:tetratricopeptide (TPR) repeat protein